MTYFRLLFTLIFVLFAGCSSNLAEDPAGGSGVTEPPTLAVTVSLVSASPSFIDAPEFSIALKEPVSGYTLGLHVGEDCSGDSFGTATVDVEATYTITSSALDSVGSYDYRVSYTTAEGELSFCSESVAYQLVGGPVLGRSASSFSGGESELSVAIDGMAVGVLALYLGAGCAGDPMENAVIGFNPTGSVTITATGLSDPGSHSYSVKYTLGEGGESKCSEELAYVLVGLPVLSLSSPSPSFSGTPELSIAIDNMAAGSITLHLDTACEGNSVGRAAIDSSTTGAVSVTADPYPATNRSYYAKYTLGTGGESACTDGVDYVQVGKPELSFSSSSVSFDEAAFDLSVSLVNSLAGNLTLHSSADCTGDAVETVAVAAGSDTESITAPSAATGEHTYSVNYTLDADGETACSQAVIYRVVGEPELSLRSPSPGFSETPELSIAIEGIVPGSIALYASADCTGTSVGDATIAFGSTGSVSVIATAASSSYSAKYTLATNDASTAPTACSDPVVYAQASKPVLSLSSSSPAFASSAPAAALSVGIANPLAGALSLHLSADCTGDAQSTEAIVSGTTSPVSITAAAVSEAGNYSYSAKYTLENRESNCSGSVDYQLVGNPALSFAPSFSPTPSGNVDIFNSAAGSLSLHASADCSGDSVGSVDVVAGAVQVVDITATAALSAAGNYGYSAKYTLTANAESDCSGEASYNLVTPDLEIKTPTYRTVTAGGDFDSDNGVYSGSNANFIAHVASGLLTEGSTVNLYSDAACATLVKGGETLAEKEVDFTMKETTEGSYSYYAKEVGSSGDLSLCSSVATYNLVAPVLDLTTDQSASATSIALTITDFANIHDDGSSNTDANSLFLYFSESNDPFSPKCSDIRFDLGSAITGNVTGISVALPAGDQFAPKDSENIYRIWAQHEGIFDDDVTLKECFFTGVVFENTDIPSSRLR